MHHSSSSRSLTRLNVGPRLFILAAVVALIVLDISGAAARPFVGGPGRPVVPPHAHIRDGKPRRIREQPLPPDLGRGRNELLAARARELRRSHRHDGRRAECALISNRIFNDLGQNLFSENNISQWGWAWGQFLDHDMGLRDETPAEDASVPFNASDPLESYSNQTGSIAFNRTPAAPGTGVTTPRQQVNTLSSYLDASNVYGVTGARATWLRNPDGTLMLPDNYLPKVGARGNAATAPAMDLMGQLAGNPNDAVVAGDVRANENLGLTAIQTLFAREHNRIVASLPNTLTGDQKYQIARQVVGAEVQYITYNEFLPALGVKLAPYRGYNPFVNAGISDEFATVGFRAHSMVHGDFDVDFEPGQYSDAQLAAFTAEGVSVTKTPDEHSLTIPLAVAFGNPDLLPQVGLGTMLAALGDEHEYKNDEQIDNDVRSVLFEIPKPDTPPDRLSGPKRRPQLLHRRRGPRCRRRHARPRPRHAELQRHASRVRPPAEHVVHRDHRRVDRHAPAGLTINNPQILDFVQAPRQRRERDRSRPAPMRKRDAVTGVRRTTLAARLKAIYGNVDNVDAFVGMVSERHVPGTEFGQLQLAIWKDQFTRLRDGDRFFYQNDPALQLIALRYGVTLPALSRRHHHAEHRHPGRGRRVPRTAARPAPAVVTPGSGHHHGDPGGYSTPADSTQPGRRRDTQH